MLEHFKGSEDLVSNLIDHHAEEKEMHAATFIGALDEQNKMIEDQIDNKDTSNNLPMICMLFFIILIGGCVICKFRQVEKKHVL